MQAHTNADDAGRYRPAGEASSWVERDPLVRIETYLTNRRVLDQAMRDEIAAAAERFARSVRDALNLDIEPDPASLFEHVYSHPTPLLEGEAEWLAEEIRLAGEEES
jgi:pyruvate dehydrogenase E1 component alpha subunit